MERQIRAFIKAGGTVGMPPINFSKRLAATRQFYAAVVNSLINFQPFLIFQPAIHRLSTRQLKPIVRTLQI